MTNISNSPQHHLPAAHTPLPAVKVTNRDIEEYTECMLRALERLARTNGHDLLAKLLRLASTEAKYLKTTHNQRA